MASAGTGSAGTGSAGARIFRAGTFGAERFRAGEGVPRGVGEGCEHERAPLAAAPSFFGAGTMTGDAPSAILRPAWQALALILVAVGLLNAMPGVPGLDAAARELSGLPWLRIRGFAPEWLRPGAFALMLAVLAAERSRARAWAARGAGWRRLGGALDLALLLAALALGAAFLVESDRICLLDRLSGERARMIAAGLEAARETAALFGLPAPSAPDDPACAARLGLALAPLLAAGCAVLLVWIAMIWGLPLALTAGLALVWAAGTAALWALGPPPGAPAWLVTPLGAAPGRPEDMLPPLRAALTGEASGLMGRFLDVILTEIFPYLVLGGLLGASAGGQALIALARAATRGRQGGAAQAAILASALFGAVSGGAVTNVLSTGRLTIPIMRRAGLPAAQAAGIEAAASAGGALMPPVMAVAAFMLAAMTATPYRDVALAALPAAVAYYAGLMLTARFEAARRGLPPAAPAPPLSRRDRANLVMVAGPAALILALLLTRKEAVGCGPLGALFGVARQIAPSGLCRAEDLPWLLELWRGSAGDAGAAGWWGCALAFALLFLDPAMRARPRRAVEAMARAGALVARLHLMFLAVAMIEIALNFTGTPYTVSLRLLGWLRELDLGGSGAWAAQLAALTATMGLAMLLGMGMPAAPAYLNAALLMGPALAGLGISVFAAHMFVFCFAVASAITPPVAVAAFAAAGIAGASPLRAALAAMRAGAALFLAPFLFAFHPEFLLVPAAQMDPAGAGGWLPGRDGSVGALEFALLAARMGLALWLMTSALAGWERARLPGWERGARLAAALGLLAIPALWWGGAAAAGMLLILRRRRPARAAGDQSPSSARALPAQTAARSASESGAASIHSPASEGFSNG